MAPTSTSFRIDKDTRQRLAVRAEQDGMSATALDHPGIVHRGPAHDRRAALAAGPDVWEVVARLQELDGSEEQRIATLAAEIDLHPRLIRIAIDYAAQHAEAVQARIARNGAAAEASRRNVEHRAALFA